MTESPKSLRCKKDLLAMPDEVIDAVGYAFHLAQLGEKHEGMKRIIF